MKFDLEKMDPAVRSQTVSDKDLEWYDSKSGRFAVSGFYWFDRDHRFARLPADGTEKIPEFVRQLSLCTSGGQLRFRSDSRRIVLRVRKMDFTKSATAETKQKDFDLYIGPRGKEEFWAAVSSGGKMEYTAGIFKTERREMREFLLNFPLYSGIEELWIGLEKDAEILSPSAPRSSRPVVIYGTSITQGGFASRPGLMFTNILSRRLQRPFLNFGFSGNGKNEPEVAELLTQVKDPAMFIIDSQGNSVSPELIRRNVPAFIRVVRNAYPKIPIVILSMIKTGPKYRAESSTHAWKKVFHRIYEQTKASGDRNIYFIDGSKFWPRNCWSDCTDDSVHPNDLGFHLIANALERPLKRLLGK